MDIEPDWKKRYRAPLLAGSAIAAHAPSHGLALSNGSGVVQAHAWHVDSGELRQVTTLPTGLRFAAIDPFGNDVYYLHDERGNEVGHLARVPWNGGEPLDLTPDDEPYAIAGFASSLDGTMIAFTTATRSGFDTFVVPKGTGAQPTDRRSVFRAAAFSPGLSLSADGTVVVIATAEYSGSIDTDLIAVDTTSGDEVARWLEPDAKLTAVAFAPDGGSRRLLVSSNHGGFARPVIWDLSSGERLTPKSDGLDGELVPLGWHPDSGSVIVRQIVAATTQLLVWDLRSGRLDRVPHDPSNVVAAYFAPDGRLLAELGDATNPPRVVALDRHAGSIVSELLRIADPPPGRPWRSVTYPSTDGSEIQAWLAEPDGDGPFPTVIDSHGGPTAARFDEWSPEAQAWLDSGFAYLSVNYRGSTTFGHDFESAIRGDLGRREADDLAAGRQRLVETGIADPDKVFLTGWSYGGYLTLLALGTHPKLWAGGVAGIAIADWTLMYEDMNETLRQYGVALFGGTPTEVPDSYARSSPITYVDRVLAPVLIFQGLNDTRCPARQLRVYEARMREAGKPIQVEWFDAGHGGLTPDQRIAFHEQALQFADDVLSD